MKTDSHLKYTQTHPDESRVVLWHGTSNFQFEINRKRDTELTKLRKLLEDVHLESEETAHLLKKKHQEIVVDFQDQIDQLTKSKAR